MDSITIKYVRDATRRLLWGAKAFYRFLAIIGIFWLIGIVVSNFLATPVLTAAMPSDLARALSEARSSGTFDQEAFIEMFSGTTAVRLLPALLFVMFLNLALSGAYNFAMARSALNIIDNPGATQREMLSGILGGLKSPFTSAWLAFRVFIQIHLWSMLFIIPGIFAFYRYRFVWRIYADHPECSAGDCIRLSKAMIKGHKKLLFRVDCGYWRELLLVVILAVVAYGGAALSCIDPKFDIPVVTIVSTLAVILLFPAFLLANFSIMLAQTVVYRAMLPNPDSKLSKACEALERKLGIYDAAAEEGEQGAASDSAAADGVGGSADASTDGSSDAADKGADEGVSGVKSLLLALGLSVFGGAAFAAPGTGATGASVNLPAREWAMVRQLAVNYDLSEEQTWLLAAIRRHENGRAGLEFGIGGPMNSGHPAHRYRDGYKSFYIQGAWAAGTVKRHFTGDFDRFGRRYCPVASGTWATRVRYLVRKLKTENGGTLPGVRPPKRKIDFP